jgi:chaperonin GroEL
VAVIKVGGDTEAAMKSRKDLVDDALHAARAAIEEGIVPGGGVALLSAVEAVNALKGKGDERFGRKIIAKALTEPLRLIAENAGENGSVVLEMVREKGKSYGFNALTHTYEDMFKTGIVDPAKVVRSALQNAASISGLLLTTDTMVTDLKDDKKQVAGSIA